MKKVAIVVVAALLLLPVLPRLMPKPITLERIEETFKKAGLAVEQAREIPNPELEAIEQFSFVIGGAMTEIYHFDDEGKIAKQQSYQQGVATSESMSVLGLSDLAASVGAAKPKNKPVTVERNGKYLIVITSEDRPLRSRIAEAFRKL